MTSLRSAGSPRDGRRLNGGGVAFGPWMTFELAGKNIQTAELQQKTLHSKAQLHQRWLT
jgi:hypothetical protein